MKENNSVNNLRLTDNHYRKVVEKFSHAIIIHTYQGTILDANQNARKLITKINKGSENLLDFFDSYFRQKAYDKFAELEPEESVRFETKISVENYLYDYEITSVVIDEEQKILISVFADISERKKTEQLVIRSERLSAVGTFAGGIAHEFNNIHTGIIGYLNLLLDHETFSNSVREKLEYALKGSLRAAQVTKRLLAFTVKKDVNKTACTLSDIVDHALEFVRGEYESEGVELVINHKSKVNLLLDKEQMVQAILNLMINAHHATLGKAKRVIEVISGIEGKRAYVKVTDNGCGIPEDELSKVFTPFFTRKGEHALSDNPMSAIKGLGLSICQTIVDSHGGEITLKSEENMGSEFYIYLPLHHGSSKIPVYRELPEVKSIEGTKVLVLDDEEMLLNLISHILGIEGCLVTAVDSGKKALEILQKTEFDIVLIDLQMPAMSGVEFMREMDKLDLDYKPIRIVITGKITTENFENYQDMDVFATIAKPFDMNDIYSYIAKALAVKEIS